MKRHLLLLCLLLTGATAICVRAQRASISVDADTVLHGVSRYLTGACLEDVNHEVYGGIYSQMIFGESFAEPPPPRPLEGFTAYAGQWTPATNGGVDVAAGDGPKLVCNGPRFSDGEASVELLFTDRGGGNAGLIVKVSEAGKGADVFNGYEVALEASGTLALGRHRHNWEPLRRVRCEVPVNEWITLEVRMKANSLEARVNGKTVIEYEDTEDPLRSGCVGLRVWQREGHFRNLRVNTGGERREFPFAYATNNAWGDGVSGMWRALRRGTAEGEFEMTEREPFSGRHSQTISFAEGAGEIGIENQGLNRWGMYFVKGKSYEGHLWARAEAATQLFVAMESRDGGRIYDETPLQVDPGGWQRIDFALSPSATDKTGRFALKLNRPGSVTIGYVFLQPGPWGRFKDLPVRKDVAEGLIDQGITVLRYGGSMVNDSEYRWKKMIGPRDRRPPYKGTWYPCSSDGWGIVDFMDFCEAAKFEYIPAFNMGERAQDMADFIDYAKGSAKSEWGRRRVADGHPEPYRLHYIELGNEERVDDWYAAKFEALAAAIWAKDTNIILVVGDFAYGQQIRDPFNFRGAASDITSLEGQQRILRFARQHDREVWFDVHIGTEGPQPDLGGTLSYIDALGKIAEGAKYRVVIFEFNAGNHSQRRALANAAAINMVERDGRLPIATSANCLQPDGQNDNGWDQGLLFLDPSQVWLQPAGYVTRMISKNYQPLSVRTEVSGAGNGSLDVCAERSEDGRVLVLRAVNVSPEEATASINLHGYTPQSATATAETLAGPLDARNTAAAPQRIATTISEWEHGIQGGKTSYTFPANSFTVLKFE